MDVCKCRLVELFRDILYTEYVIGIYIESVIILTGAH